MLYYVLGKNILKCKLEEPFKRRSSKVDSQVHMYYRLILKEKLVFKWFPHQSFPLHPEIIKESKGWTTVLSLSCVVHHLI